MQLRVLSRWRTHTQREVCSFISHDKISDILSVWVYQRWHRCSYAHLVDHHYLSDPLRDKIWTPLMYMRWLSATLMAPYRAFIKAGCRDRVLYLYREPSAIYAVFGASRSITLAPVKLHLLCLETSRQSSTSYKVVILQENGNWRQSRQKMEENG